MAVVYLCNEGHAECRESEAEYHQLAKEMVSSGKDLRFFAMDIIENEVENVKIRGFPTFYVYQKKNKHPKIYDKSFKKTELQEYLESLLSSSFKEAEL